MYIINVNRGQDEEGNAIISEGSHKTYPLWSSAVHPSVPDCLDQMRCIEEEVHVPTCPQVRVPYPVCDFPRCTIGRVEPEEQAICGCAIGCYRHDLQGKSLKAVHSLPNEVVEHVS